MCDELSRMKSSSHGRFGKESDRWGFTQASAIRVTGRHIINIWRALRGELNLTQYTLENVTFHLLHKRYVLGILELTCDRVPHYSHADLTKWYQGDKRSRVFSYYLSRCLIDLEILESQELVARVWYVAFWKVLILSEQARVLGIDFYSVFNRGSQFKVESLVLRIAKAECFMLISPNRKQVIIWLKITDPGRPAKCP